MRKFLLNANILLLFGVLISGNAAAQIMTFEFAGKPGDQVTENSNFNDAKLSSAVISRGSGITATGNTDRFNSTNWDATATIGLNDYVEFTVTPTAGNKFTIANIVLQHQRSGTGPKSFVIRTSLDAFAANSCSEVTIPDVTTTQTTTFTLNLPSQNQPLTIRVYGYNSEGTTGTWGPGDFAGGNDIVVNGTTEADAFSAETDITSFSIPQQTGSATINPTNHTVNIEVEYGTPVASLVPTIGLSNGATISPASNASRDFTLPVTYNVTAEDGITTQPWVVTVTVSTVEPGPKVVATTPINKALDIATNASFSLTFDTNIQKKSGSLRVFKAVNDQEVASISVTDISVNGKVAEVSLPSPLEVSHSYYIKVDKGTFSNLAGLDFDGITSDIAWQFTTNKVSSNATLIDLKVDGTTVTGFSPATLEYTISYPYGTAEVPDVTYTLMDITATVTTTDPTVLPGYSTVEVTAQDGKTNLTYKVNFSWSAASTNASVTSSIYSVNEVDGTITNVPANTTIEAFRSNLTPAPNATFEVYSNARAAIATDIQTGYKVVVTAQDGITKKSYTITLLTGIDTQESILVDTYPNPFTSDFTIKAGRVIHSVSLSNLLGQKQMEQAVDRSEVGVSLPNFPVGVYIVTIIFEDGTSTKLRMVKR